MVSVSIVCATRLDEASFYSKSALGRSLRQAYRAFPVKPRIAFQNSKPLAVCYNDALASCEKEDIIVFVHDDVLLLDFFWIDRLEFGFTRFDILGIVGNKRRVPRQASWCWLDEKFTVDDIRNLSGGVALGQEFPCTLYMLGATGQRCKLLDGILLAARSATLKKSGIRFDAQFPFHFYDLDWCRQAELAGLRMGTIPLSVVHQGESNANTPEWRSSYERYLAKWKE